MNISDNTDGLEAFVTQFKRVFGEDTVTGTTPEERTQNLAVISQLFDGMLTSSIWRVAPVTDEPEVKLSHWSIRESLSEGSYAKGSRHFVGLTESRSSGRVSTPILEFDPVSCKGRTESGRVYELVGESGSHPDSNYVWGRFAYINGILEYKDISKEITQ